jgi:hypothetical protein
MTDVSSASVNHIGTTHGYDSCKFILNHLNTHNRLNEQQGNKEESLNT